MSITEKELAEKVTAIYHEGPDLEATMRNIARTAAELLGAELAPEKPEPGTWHIVDAGGYKGRPAHVTYIGCLRVYVNDAGETYTFAKSEKWPDLTPARVVPAEPVELSDGSLVRAWNEAMDAESDTDLQWDRVTAWAFMGKGDQAVLRRFAHNLLAKHGGARELPTWNEVRSAVEQGFSNPVGPLARNVTDAVMDLLGGGDDE